MAVPEKARPEPPAARDCRAERTVRSWADGTWNETSDRVAEEVPVALVYGDVSYAVMLTTPANLEDFAVGFSLTEGIVEPADLPLAMEVRRHITGIELRVDLPAERAAALSDEVRALAGRSGCGLCGTRHLESAVRWPQKLATTLKIDNRAVQNALRQLTETQGLNAQTGTVHAAAWADLDGRVLLLREDIGRHNALDKLIGAMARSNLDPAHGFAVVTSRASYEMVQKTASAGIACLAAVSGPTELAVRMAESANLTLVGFARRGRHVVYSHAWRLAGDDTPEVLP